MPPSYSMMLPGRMSTPLIFMGIHLLERALGQPARPPKGAPLTVGHRSRKQRVGIDRLALPPAIAGSHERQAEMKVKDAGRRIAAVADISQHIAGIDSLSLVHARGIAREMGIIILPLPVRRSFVEGRPALVGVKQLLDRARRGGDHW